VNFRPRLFLVIFLVSAMVFSKCSSDAMVSSSFTRSFRSWTMSFRSSIRYSADVIRPNA